MKVKGNGMKTRDEKTIMEKKKNSNGLYKTPDLFCLPVCKLNNKHMQRNTDTCTVMEREGSKRVKGKQNPLSTRGIDHPSFASVTSKENKKINSRDCYTLSLSVEFSNFFVKASFVSSPLLWST